MTKKINKTKLSKLSNFQDAFILRLAKSKNQQKLYLQNAFEDYRQDKDLPAFLLALRTIAIAKGGIIELSNKTNLNRQTIYKALSLNGNPSFAMMDLILNSLGAELRLKQA